MDCNFTTIEAFFDNATENGLNITAEIEQCPNLCLLTFGTGNPDLSGIGVSGLFINSAPQTSSSAIS